MIAQLSARFQATCEHLEAKLNALAKTPPAEIVLNIVGTDHILRRAAIVVRQAQQHVSLMGGSPELAALEPDLKAAVVRGVSARIVSVGSAPAVAGQVTTFVGENVSAPTRFLLIIVDAATALIATFPPDASGTAVMTGNPILCHLFSAFLNTEYYLVRVSNTRPALVRQLLAEVLEPEDRERYAGILDVLAQQAAADAAASRP